jgi:hypothetical protein
MARRPMAMPLFEPACDRRQFLADRDEVRDMVRQEKRCRKINTRPGFQKLANMKFNRG